MQTVLSRTAGKALVGAAAPKAARPAVAVRAAAPETSTVEAKDGYECESRTLGQQSLPRWLCAPARRSAPAGRPIARPH